MLGVELWEWRDDAEPCWVRSELARAIEDDGRGIVAKTEHGMANRDMDRIGMVAAEWFTASDGSEDGVPEPPKPVEDEWGNPVTLFGTEPLYCEADLKRQRKAETKAARKQRKRGRKVAAGNAAHDTATRKLA